MNVSQRAAPATHAPGDVDLLPARPVGGARARHALWIGCVAFVVYGSLVPLDFTPHPLDRMWHAFLHMPLLAIGPESRADWVSNIVLYVPVGFLTAQALLPGGRRSATIAPLFAAGAFSVALAFAVEFAQLFFPPRTVSLNDIAAECIGSAIGVALAWRYADAVGAVLDAPFTEPQRLVGHALVGYAIGYFVLALFPFDVVLSLGELKGRLGSEHTGWWLAEGSSGRVRTSFKLVLEALLAAPLAWALAFRRPRLGVGAAMLLGAGLGAVLEVAQLLTISGVSQGASVAARAGGMALGLLLWRRRGSLTLTSSAAWVRRHVIALVPIYMAALLAVNRWFPGDWLGFDTATQRWSDMRVLPFYYHYYTTEVEAVLSLAGVCLMYLPIGVLAWCCRGRAAHAAVVAFVVAAIVEGGKLFLRGTHPDPTNLSIAALAAWGTVRALAAVRAAGRPEHGVARAAPNPAPPRGGMRLVWHDAAWLGVLLIVGVGVAQFPVQRAALGLLIAAAVGATWTLPPVAISIAVAALPALDWAPWSGRLYIDEFDLVFLAVIATAYRRLPPRRTASGPDRPLRIAVALVTISLAVAVASGLLPWQAPDANSFLLLTSPYNSLRLAKGALWALALCALAHRVRGLPGAQVESWLAGGMVAGLAMTAAFIVWERATLTGLFDFQSEYRVTGPFSAMHTGGAYIEAFLVTALPFLIAVAMRVRTGRARTAAVPMLVISAYCVMVTFSRSGYAAFVAAALIGLGTSVVRGRGQSRSWGRAALLGATMAVVAVPIYESPFAQSRFAAVRNDLAARTAHWSDAFALRPRDSAGRVFGIGLGTFAGHYFWHSAQRSGNFELAREADNAFVRFGSGEKVYLEQFVAVKPGEVLTARLTVRSNVRDGRVVVSICDKWLLDSRACVRKAPVIDREPGDWQTIEIRFNSGGLGGGHFPLARPVKFSIQSPSVTSTLDIDDLHLTTSSGRDLLANGDFSVALDHWYFAADNHLQWHVKSLPLAVLIEQGWFGVVAFASFVGLALTRVWRASRAGLPFAGALLAALCAFLIVGAFDTLIDTPRFLMLLLVLCYFCSASGDSRVRHAETGLPEDGSGPGLEPGRAQR